MFRFAKGFLNTRNKSKITTKTLLFFFYDVMILSLLSVGAFPEKRPLKYKMTTFLMYKVFPVIMVLSTIPMVVAVMQKLVQLVNDKNLEDAFDTIPMFIVGCFAVYCMIVMQMKANDCKSTIDLIKNTFFAVHDLTTHDVLIIYSLWFALLSALFLYVGGCSFYGEVFVPMRLPFMDSEKELTAGAFYFIMVYQTVTGYYLLCTLALWGPFMVVSTICVRKELEILIKAVLSYQYIPRNISITDRPGTARTTVEPSDITSPWPTLCSTEEETKQFLHSFVEHHLIVKRTIDYISNIHFYIFLVQTILLVVHSCVVAFHMYHTNHKERVFITSTPVLFVSYYMMFIYCWNGQRLTDKSEELFHATYSCPWYNCPRSLKTSLSVMMEVFAVPVKLTGGGIFAAEFSTFLKCAEQSVSYILLLKELTPQGQ